MINIEIEKLEEKSQKMNNIEIANMIILKHSRKEVKSDYIDFIAAIKS